MKNDEVLIHIANLNGTIYQTFYKEKKQWYERSSTGRIFECTAEQVINHIIPALSIKSDKVKVIVERKA